MGRASGLGMTDHNAWPIYRSDDCSFSAFFRNQQLCATLRFLVGILECLSHMDFRFQCEIVTITRNIGRAYVLQPTAGNLFHEMDNVPRSIDIHPKDMVAI